MIGVCQAKEQCKGLIAIKTGWDGPQSRELWVPLFTIKSKMAQPQVQIQTSSLGWVLKLLRSLLLSLLSTTHPLSIYAEKIQLPSPH